MVVKRKKASSKKATKKSTAKKGTARKSTAKKGTARKTTKKKSSRKAGAKKGGAKKATKKGGARKSAAKKGGKKKKAAKKGGSSRKAASKSKGKSSSTRRAAPKKAAPRTMSFRSVAPKATPNKIEPSGLDSSSWQGVPHKGTLTKLGSKKNSPKSSVTSSRTANLQTTTRTTSRSSADLAKRAVEVTGVGFLGIVPYPIKDKEAYMNDKHKSHFRDILMKWKQALMEEVDRTVHHMKDAINFADPNDRATQEEEFTFELRARDRERKLIRKIDEALARLEADDYGYCDACGVEIGIRRLEARPTATLCIDCKTLDEIKEKQTRL